MANVVRYWGTPGDIPYFLIWVGDQVWDKVSLALVTFNSANLSNYANALTATGSGGGYLFTGAIPSGVPANALALAIFDGGATPAISDPVVGTLQRYWDGTNLMTVDEKLASHDATIVAEHAAISAAIAAIPGGGGGGAITYNIEETRSVPSEITASWKTNSFTLIDNHTSVTLPSIPVAASMIVWHDGLSKSLEAGDGYTLIGTTVTLSTAVSEVTKAGDCLIVRYQV